MRMLVGEKVSLRPVRADDIDRWMVWMNDPEIICNLYSRSIYGFTRKHEEEFFQLAQKIDTQVIFSIDTLTGDHVGTIGLHSINREWANAELGIMIGDKSQWGKGLCTDAINIMTGFAFDYMNLHRVYLYVNSDNIGGIRCYEKAGFVREGVLRDHRYWNGEYGDIVLMGILKTARS